MALYNVAAFAESPLLIIKIKDFLVNRDDSLITTIILVYITFNDSLHLIDGIEYSRCAIAGADVWG